MTGFYNGQYSDTRQKYRDMHGEYTREKIQTAWAHWPKVSASPVGPATDQPYCICADIILKVYDRGSGFSSQSWEIEIQHMIYSAGGMGSGGPLESFPVLTKKFSGYGYDNCKDKLVWIHCTYDFRENEAYRMSIIRDDDGGFCFNDDDRDRFHLKSNSSMPPSFWRELPDVENASPNDPLVKDYFKRAEEFLFHKRL